MEAVMKSRRVSLVVLAALALALAGLGAYAAFSSNADAAGVIPPDPANPLSPALMTESGVVGLDECFVTTQKAMEGPLVVSEEIFEPFRDPDGNFIDRRDGSIIPPHPITGESSRDHEFILHVSTEEFRDFLKEIEIIKVISACAAEFKDPRSGEKRTGIRDHVSTFVVTCKKHVDLGDGDCFTRRGEFERHDSR